MNNQGLEIRLEGPSTVTTPTTSATIDYSDENDDVRTILTDICAVLEQTNGVHFVVRAFDETNWSVSVATDLCVLLEQLPQVAQAVQDGRAFELDFFEQGIERTLQFQPEGPDFIISCASRHATWVPKWETERVSQMEVRRALAQLSGEFTRLATMIAPNLVRHRWLKEWAFAVRSLGGAANAAQD